MQFTDSGGCFFVRTWVWVRITLLVFDVYQCCSHVLFPLIVYKNCVRSGTKYYFVRIPYKF